MRVVKFAGQRALLGQNRSAMPVRVSMYSVGRPMVLQSCLRHFMPDPQDEFADVARQLEETLSEINQVSDPVLRRKLLADMRRLIAGADRLAAKGAKANDARQAQPRKTR